MALPCHILAAAFDDAFASRLLAYALDNRQRFQPATVISDRESGVLDHSSRISLTLRDLGPLKQEIRARLKELAPALLERVGIAPFDIARIEVEMAAHNDGAFFEPHVDTYDDESGALRLMSAVYYFHREPRRYSGGALRLFALGAREGEARFQDIVPDHNSLVVFPSWLPHEVRRISCPSGDFDDSRFAVNAWFLRAAQA